MARPRPLLVSGDGVCWSFRLSDSSSHVGSVDCTTTFRKLPGLSAGTPSGSIPLLFPVAPSVAADVDQSRLLERDGDGLNSIDRRDSSSIGTAIFDFSGRLALSHRSSPLSLPLLPDDEEEDSETTASVAAEMLEAAVGGMTVASTPAPNLASCLRTTYGRQSDRRRPVYRPRRLTGQRWPSWPHPEPS
jgi:hypothetical protein